MLPISLIASLITASKAMNALERAFNQAYEVSQPRKYFYGRVIGVLMTTLVMGALIIALTLPSMGKTFFEILKVGIRLGSGVELFFYYGRWLITMVGMMALSAGFSFFIKSFSNISFVYGSLGTVVTLMIWLYFAGMLLMLGAEINGVLLEWHEKNEKE